MNIQKRLCIAALYTAMLIIGGCTPPRNAPEKSIGAKNFVCVTQDPHHATHYFITPKAPVSYITDLDFNNPQDVAFAEELVTTALELSRIHENADFRLRMNHKNGHLITTVSLYPASSCKPTSICPFCPPRHLRGAIIAENATMLAFEISTPAQNPIHFLIIPKQHIVNYEDPAFTPQIFVQQLAMAQQFARQLTDPTAIDLHVNNGANAKQTVCHSHMHFKSTAQWKK